ncbi:alpha/beta hydrolase family protein [uncultured Microbacterium sp.]|uniref:alpha/beta hydrolase family protein n=1 Tax=uncultured Microbacterium sp. TaxID=191216 RepID=UPI00374932FB
MATPLPLADYIPTTDATPAFSYGPVSFEVPGREVDLEMRVSAPSTGDNLPVLLLSHGHGNLNYVASMHGYNPLVDFFASHGFVVIQPTHLNSKTLGLDPTGPEGPLFWRTRARDLRFILDHLDEIAAAVPGLTGRIDPTRIAALGHSAGGQTVDMLLGQTAHDPAADNELVNEKDDRVKVGVVLAAAGGGADLSDAGKQRFAWAATVDFSDMTTPTLVMVGDDDVNPMFSSRPDWRADSYILAPGSKSLVTFIGGKHSFGGVSGYDVSETTDPSTERVSVVQRLATAYIRSVLDHDPELWTAAANAATRTEPPPGADRKQVTAPHGRSLWRRS